MDDIRTPSESLRAAYRAKPAMTSARVGTGAEKSNSRRSTSANR